MPDDGELPAEFQPPVAYDDLWLWLAVGAVAAVVVYYVVVWWITRPPRARSLARTGIDLPDVRRDHLAAIDAVAARVHAGELTSRVGHQELSAVVRSYVAAVTTLPATTMALADFRSHAPGDLVGVIELLYPPEFAPVTDADFDDAADRSRALVADWAVTGA